MSVKYFPPPAAITASQTTLGPDGRTPIPVTVTTPAPADATTADAPTPSPADATTADAPKATPAAPKQKSTKKTKETPQ